VRWILILAGLVITQNLANSKDAWLKMEPVSFLKLEVLQEKLSIHKLDATLLDAAIFHETNRMRVTQQLEPLLPSQKAFEAAREHSRWMVKTGNLSHEGAEFDGRKSTPLARLKHHGISPAMAAENVAFGFILEYESGRPVYSKKSGSKMVFSYTADGPPLPARNYVEMARAIVTQFMESPEHRKNILLKGLTHSGMGVALLPDKDGMDRVYVTQKFFALAP